MHFIPTNLLGKWYCIAAIKIIAEKYMYISVYIYTYISVCYMQKIYILLYIFTPTGYKQFWPRIKSDLCLIHFMFFFKTYFICSYDYDETILIKWLLSCWNRIYFNADLSCYETIFITEYLIGTPIRLLSCPDSFSWFSEQFTFNFFVFPVLFLTTKIYY